LLPAFDSCEDAAWIGGPDEWFWIGVVLRDEAIDGGFKVVDGSEDAAPQALALEFGEEALDGVEPGCGSRGEVEGPAGMVGQP
jgi:hypothetical protein